MGAFQAGQHPGRLHNRRMLIPDIHSLVRQRAVKLKCGSLSFACFDT